MSRRPENRRPERTPLDCYLDRICRRLWLVPARERRDTREELRQHLERMAAHAARTVPMAEAMEDAMKKFGDPKQIGGELSRQHLHRRRWLSVLLKTAAGVSLTLLVLVVGYSGYWYFALSKPMEREPTPTPIVSAAATLATIQAAQDGYARQIQSVRFQGVQEVHTFYQAHPDKMVPHTYQVAAKGDRYYSRDASTFRSGDSANPICHVDDVYVSDGRTMRENLVSWNGSESSHHRGERHGGIAYLRDNKFKPHDSDEVLQYGYKVHGVWIGDMLRRGMPTVEGTVTDSQFGPLTVVRCRNKTAWGADEAVRVWLAPKLGWLAVKTESSEAGARPPFALRTVYEARQFVKVGAFWAASEGRFHYDAVGAGRQQEIAAHPERFSDIAFNDVPDSQFVLHDPVGTRVLSVDFQNTFVRQPSGQWKKEAAFPESDSTSIWSHLIMGLTVLGAGVSYLVVMRKRRRPRLAA